MQKSVKIIHVMLPGHWKKCSIKKLLRSNNSLQFDFSELLKGFFQSIQQTLLKAVTNQEKFLTTAQFSALLRQPILCFIELLQI